MPAAKTKPARKDAAGSAQRLRLVAVALQAGTPQRQIALELECDERTIRFDREKLELLDSAALEAILHGAPADPLLKAARKERGAPAQPGGPKPRTVALLLNLIFHCLEEEWTVTEERVTPFVGREIVEHKLRLFPAYQEQVLQDLDTSSNPLVFRKAGGKRLDVVERCRPQWIPDPKEGMPARLTWYIEWLRAWLPLVVPDQVTLDAAIAAARARVEREPRSVSDTSLRKPRRKRAKRTQSNK